MDLKKTILSLACGLAAASLVTGAAFAANAPDPNRTNYTKTIVPLGNGYGIARITNTEVSTDTAFAFRSVSSGAISCAKDMGDGTYKVFGAQTGFGTNPLYANTDNDVSAFNFSFSPASPDTLTVWRNWLYTSMRTPTIGCTDVGLGAVSNNGLISARIDGYSGGAVGNGCIGAMDGTSGRTSPLQIPDFISSQADWTNILSGGTTTICIPGMGNDDSMMSWDSYSNYIAVGRANLNPSGTDISSVTPNNNHAEEIYMAGLGNRGAPSVNSAAHVVAMYTKLAADVSDQIGGLFYATYHDNTTSVTVDSASDIHVYDFSGAIPGKLCSGANYFGRTTFGGPCQVSVNDLGDVVFPVVIVPTAGPTAGDWRSVSERGILFMDHNTPGVFQVVCRNDDGSCSPAMFYDGKTRWAPTIVAAVDNSKNVFFQYTNWMAKPAASTLTTNCIYKATANNSTAPTKWSVKPIVWVGQQFKDVETGKTHSIAAMNLFNNPDTTGTYNHEWFVSSDALAHKNLNRTPILSNSIGGFLISVGLGSPYVAGGSAADNSLYMNACYIAPTNGTPNASTVAQAAALADGEGVNLMDLAISAYTGTTTDSSGNIWYQYTAKDKAGSAINFETIRQGLPVNGIVYVSGKMYTSTIDSSRYIHSAGVVLVDMKRIGMANKSATATLAVSQPTRVWGKVTSVDTTGHTLVVDDGSGSPTTVNYTAVFNAFAHKDASPTNLWVPSVGDYVAAGGNLSVAGTVTMTAFDNIQKLN